MDEQRIRQIIQEELSNWGRDNRFSVADVPLHIHNGTDSPRVDADNLVFTLPYLRLFQATSTPGVFINGAICSVGGTLFISDGVSWIKVGAQ